MMVFWCGKFAHLGAFEIIFLAILYFISYYVPPFSLTVSFHSSFAILLPPPSSSSPSPSSYYCNIASLNFILLLFLPVIHDIP